MYPTAVILLIHLSDHYAHRTLSLHNIYTAAARADVAATSGTGQPVIFSVSLPGRRSATESESDIRSQGVVLTVPASSDNIALEEKLVADV